MPPPSNDGSRNHLSLSPASHVIVCGFGPLGEAVVRALVSFGATIIGIAQEADFEEIPSTVITIEGDPTSEDVLSRASIERASALISTVEGDDDNALVCLTARSLSPKIRLVVRGASPQSIEILKRLGADAVVCPEIDEGPALARAILDDTGETKTVSKGR